METPQKKWMAWIEATRPRVFVASFVPMGIAMVIAIEDGVFKPLIFLLSMIGVMALQTTANLVNEYADFKKGSDSFKQAGQSMTLKKKLLSPNEIFWGAVVATTVGVAIGLFMLSQSGIYLLWIGLGGVLVAITYTAGPFPLAYHGLGEITAGIFMGPMIVLGAYYVMSPNIPTEKGLMLSLIAFPVMFTTAAILHANNLRDLDADRQANKRTLAVRFGRQIARLEYRMLLGMCYISQVILVIVGLMPATTFLTFLTIPQAIRLINVFDQQIDPLKLHIAQGQTAQLHGKIGLFMVVGWVIAIILAI